MKDKLPQKINLSGALLLTWLLPGAGHWYIGRKLQGVLLGSLIMMTYGAGLLMGEFTVVSLTRLFFPYFCCQILAGGPTLIALAYCPADNQINPCLDPNLIVDIGVLYTSVAALLNGLLMLHLWELYATARQMQEESKT